MVGYERVSESKNIHNPERRPERAAKEENGSERATTDSLPHRPEKYDQSNSGNRKKPLPVELSADVPAWINERHLAWPKELLRIEPERVTRDERPLGHGQCPLSPFRTDLITLKPGRQQPQTKAESKERKQWENIPPF